MNNQHIKSYPFFFSFEHETQSNNQAAKQKHRHKMTDKDNLASQGQIIHREGGKLNILPKGPRYPK